MKPRLYKSQGIWRCAGFGRIGLGYEPADAYAEWWALVRKQWPPPPSKQIPWAGNWYAV
jgi:hypothetical protein